MLAAAIELSEKTGTDLVLPLPDNDTDATDCTDTH